MRPPFSAIAFMSAAGNAMAVLTKPSTLQEKKISFCFSMNLRVEGTCHTGNTFIPVVHIIKQRKNRK